MVIFAFKVPVSSSVMGLGEEALSASSPFANGESYYPLLRRQLTAKPRREKPRMFQRRSVLRTGWPGEEERDCLNQLNSLFPQGPVWGKNKNRGHWSDRGLFQGLPVAPKESHPQESCWEPAPCGAWVMSSADFVCGV